MCRCYCSQVQHHNVIVQQKVVEKKGKQKERKRMQVLNPVQFIPSTRHNTLKYFQSLIRNNNKNVPEFNTNYVIPLVNSLCYEYQGNGINSGPLPRTYRIKTIQKSLYITLVLPRVELGISSSCGQSANRRTGTLRSSKDIDIYDGLPYASNWACFISCTGLFKVVVIASFTGRGSVTTKSGTIVKHNNTQ